MNSQVREYLQQISDLRNELSSLDEKIINSPQAEQPKYSQRIFDICLEIDRIEAEIHSINQRRVDQLNVIRQTIISAIDQFNQWRLKMREVEQLFLINFVRPGFTLKQAILQREYLESALQLLKDKILLNEIHSITDLNEEIQSVLTHADNGYEADQRSYEDENIKTETIWNMLDVIDPQDIVDTANEDRIIREFKKIVLPAVHPDTSDTPVETFLVVKEVFEAGDILLMEGYTVQFKGEIQLDEQTNQSEVEGSLADYEHQYHNLASRLERRLAALKSELTDEELTDLDNVREKLRQQREEIRRLIQVETAKIFNLRKEIMDLIQLFLKINKGGTGA